MSRIALFPSISVIYFGSHSLPLLPWAKDIDVDPFAERLSSFDGAGRLDAAAREAVERLLLRSDPFCVVSEHLLHKGSLARTICVSS